MEYVKNLKGGYEKKDEKTFSFFGGDEFVCCNGNYRCNS